MKKSSWHKSLLITRRIPLFMILFGFLALSSCEKENFELPEPKIITPSDETNHSTELEKKFFDLELSSHRSASSRTVSDWYYHPQFRAAYNEIQRQNEIHDFVEDIVPKIGFPLWKSSYVHFDEEQNIRLTMIPFAFSEGSNVTSIISVEEIRNELETETEGEEISARFIVNAVTRQDILTGNVESDEALQLAAFAEWFLIFERNDFNATDEAFLDKACELEGGTADSQPPTSRTCEWRLMELCSDPNTQLGWLAGGELPDFPVTQYDHDGDGVHNMHDPEWLELFITIGDHDGDGILNDDDQDWLEMQQRFGPFSWSDIVLNWWNVNFSLQFGNFSLFWQQGQDHERWGEFYGEFQSDYGSGGFYEDFYEDGDGYGGGGTIDWRGIIDWIVDRFDGRDPDPWTDCPDMDPLSGGGSRSVNCDLFLVWDCGETDFIEWWNTLEYIPCSECADHPDYWLAYQELVRTYMNNAWGHEVNWNNYFNFVNNGNCNGFEIGFEECLRDLHWDWLVDNSGNSQNYSYLLLDIEHNTEVVQGLFGYLFSNDLSDPTYINNAEELLTFFQQNPELDIDKHTYWLLKNMNVLSETNTFITTRTDLLMRSRLDATESYVELMATDADFNTFVVNEFPTLPAWMWPLIREMGIEIAVDLAKKYGPAGIVTDVVDAVKNLGQGDILGFMGEVIDIVRRKVPALAAVSLAFDAGILGSKAAKVWRAIAKMENFGNDVIEKLLGTMGSHLDDLLGKFAWKNNTVGAELFDIANPQQFLDDFLAKFPSVDGPNFLNPQFPLEQTYFIGSLTIRFYPVSNTTGGPTLTFIISGSPPFKIRFQ